MIQIDKEHSAALEVLEKAVSELRGMWIGRKVRVLEGPYEGRQAIIDGVMALDGEFLFLCMVLRKNGTGKLNTDGESRYYRPVREFEEW